MLLSEAILIGAAKRPMCRGRYFEFGGDGIRSCTLGAAYEAVAGKPPASVHFSDRHIAETLESRFPELNKRMEDDARVTLAESIIVKSDDGETRENIAAWLADCGY